MPLSTRNDGHPQARSPSCAHPGRSIHSPAIGLARPSAALDDEAMRIDGGGGCDRERGAPRGGVRAGRWGGRGRGPAAAGAAAPWRAGPGRVLRGAAGRVLWVATGLAWALGMLSGRLGAAAARAGLVRGRGRRGRRAPPPAAGRAHAAGAAGRHAAAGAARRGCGGCAVWPGRRRRRSVYGAGYLLRRRAGRGRREARRSARCGAGRRIVAGAVAGRALAAGLTALVALVTAAVAAPAGRSGGCRGGSRPGPLRRRTAGRRRVAGMVADQRAARAVDAGIRLAGGGRGGRGCAARRCTRGVRGSAACCAGSPPGSPTVPRWSPCSRAWWPVSRSPPRSWPPSWPAAGWATAGAPG